MVGAPTSNRCDTCKKRKIKCDENWPICGPCTRSRRHCPGPPARLRFVNRMGPRQETPTVQFNFVDTTESCASPRMMVPVRSKSAESGGIFHKMRLRQPVPKKAESDVDVSMLNRELTPVADPEMLLLMKPIPHTRVDELCHAFATQLSIDDIRYRLEPYGHFLKHLPSRCGYSPALDDSAICFLSAHASFLRAEPPRKWIVPKLYGRALCSLQKALNDPYERFSTNTLAATALMQRLEQTFSAFYSTKAVIHAGGMYRSLLSRGPPNPHDELEVYLSVENTGPVISYALTHDKYLFFDLPEWKDRHLAIPGLTWEDQMYYHLYDRVSSWPAITGDYKRSRHEPHLIDRCHLLSRARDLVSSLQDFGQMVQPFFEDGESIMEVPSATSDPLVPMVYRFANLRLAGLFCHFWSISLCANRVLMDLEDSPEIITELSIANMDLRQQIWMMWEFVEDRRPLGCPFALTGLLYSYEGAYPPMDEWIVDKVNQLEGYRGEDRLYFTPELLLISFAIATGRYP